jgi:hypothetical protein
VMLFCYCIRQMTDDMNVCARVLTQKFLERCDSGESQQIKKYAMLRIL